MRVRRSLTIKQMAAVSSIAAITICIFIVIQLFHFVQQRRDDYAQQLENIAHSVREPLSQAVLDVDLEETQDILNTLQPVGILSRADVVMPNQIAALHTHFPPGRPVPQWVTRGFNLPVTISVPLYSAAASPKAPKPLAYLVLQADSYRMYQFIVSALSTMLTTYLLLSLILTISVSWVVNRLIVKPLRTIASELESLPESEVPYHQLVLPERHEDDEIGMLVRSYNRNQQQLEKAQQSMNDALLPAEDTLNNAEQFMQRLQHRLHSSEPEKGFHLLLIGIESLRDDGHVSCPLISSIMDVLPEHCLLARLSYNEFALLAGDVPRPFMAMRLARQIMERINAPQESDSGNMSLHPTGSIGIVQHTGETPVTAQQLMANARAARVSAYQQGKNQILFFEPELTEKIQKRLLQENEILHAMEQNDFTLFIQPQVNMETGTVVGAEALLRRKMANGSYGLESDFIVLAEEIGVMSMLGYKILELGCGILADWQQRGITLPLSVNLSGVQVQQRNFLPELRSLLSRYKINPGQLVLEITETARIDDLDRALLLLSELRAVGVSIELDDFGLGYSGLDYLNRLRSLPIDVIKIDRSFVSVLPEDEVMVNIVASIGRAMDIQLIAEGVETEAQRQWLLKENIQFGQGYLFSAPLSKEEFEQKFCQPA
ncbi:MULTISPECIES: biofilm formation regulator HmsP [Rahnella]|uniref:Biofilm formation regulator HmsP n=1 Tax=Rahnella laticis TaxID=2787622 RepID=A0ABS0E712_9GAMM|nr:MULTISPECIES: biofilm formation regulator HmsP [Rahnella]MBF7980802.1 biofilm formation regulator HmsP [Rahnella laticis]MBF8000893.1 biofilm formation regulator HmsP [Rahnella sp. LAC-M12]MBV6818645.1 biofilm formation regulator HmsP [Rahnella sp. PD12R]